MRRQRLYIVPFFLLLFSAVAMAQKKKKVMLDTVSVMMQPIDAGQTGTVSFDSIGLQKAVIARTVPKRLIDSLKAADEFWYANAEPVKKKPKAQQAQPQKKSLFRERWFRNMLWVIILSSFIGVVLWYLVSSNIFIFRKDARKISAEEGGEGTLDDIFALDYDKEIAAATEGGNYRLAVRLWYLHTLKELADKGVIDYRYGRTNQDYVTQLSKSAYYRDFFRLTRNFEYTWYGQFELSAETYEMMRNDFVNFKSSLR